MTSWFTATTPEIRINDIIVHLLIHQIAAAFSQPDLHLGERHGERAAGRRMRSANAPRGTDGGGEQDQGAQARHCVAGKTARNWRRRGK